MNCETMNCIYVLKCTGCHKIYIGETNNLHHRINLHKDHAARNCKKSVGIFINVSSMKSNKFYVKPFFKIINDNKYLRKKWKQTSFTNLNLN